jgi:hypothetical protein
MENYDMKTSPRSNAAKDQKVSATLNSDTESNPLGWQEAVARQFASTLEKTASGQKTTNLKRICQALVAQARKGI